MQQLEEYEKTKKSLGAVKRAFEARGESDFELVRAFATAFGFGNVVDDFAKDVFGVSNTSSQPGAELMDNFAEISQAVKSVLVENPKDRRVRVALAIVTALSLIELAQLAVVLPLSWVVGVGASGQAPLAAALGVALASREVTRPLRLALQIWLGLRVNRQLKDWSPSQRVGTLRNYLLVILGAVAAAGLILFQADRMLGAGLGRAAATSSLGANTLFGKTHLAPLVLLFRALTDALQPLLAPIGLSKLLEPTAVAKAVSSFCALVIGRARALAAACVVMSEWARTLKPFNALLDLAETDAWLAESVVALVLRVRAWAMLPFVA